MSIREAGDPAGSTSEFGEGSLRLEEWQLWHTFSSFLALPLPPLEDVARNLVHFGVAECAATSKGDAWWNTDEPSIPPLRAGHRTRPIAQGRVDVRVHAGGERATLNIPATPNPYERECLFQFGQSRFGELRLLGQGPLPPHYVQAFLGPCRFHRHHDDGRASQVYPCIKIFETGVVLVELRMFSPPESMPAQRFIERYLNASLDEFWPLEVPPGVAAWAPSAALHPAGRSFLARWKFARLQHLHERAVTEGTSIKAEGDFVHQYFSLSTATVQELAMRRMLEIRATVRHNVLKAALERLSRPEHRGGDGGSVVQSTEGAAPAPSAATYSDVNSDERRRESISAVVDEELGREWERAYTEAAAEAADSIPESFSGFALTLMSVASYVAGLLVSAPSGGLRRLLGRASTNAVGPYWHGRPHVHLIRFARQADSAAENEARFGNDFGAILARTHEAWALGRHFLPNSTRRFDDFGEYLSGGAILWVHTTRSTEASEHPDLNRGGLLHAHQAKAELLEYGYALHRRLAHQAMSTEPELLDLLRTQRELADFEWAVQDTGTSGETRDSLAAGWNAFGIAQIRDTVAELLRVRQEVVAHADATVSSRWNAVLGVLATILAAPPLADYIVSPLWVHLYGSLPSGMLWSKLGPVGVAFGLVGAIVVSGARWSTRVRRRLAGGGVRHSG